MSIISFFNGIFAEREIIKHSSMVFLSGFVSGLSLFIANILISRWFGPFRFGNFRTVMSLFTFLPAILDLGASATLIRYVAGLKDRQKISYLVKWFLKLRFFAYLIVFSCIFLLKDYIAIYLLKDISLSYLIIPGILISCVYFFLIFNWIVIGFQNFKLLSISNFLMAFLPASLGIIFAYFTNMFYTLMVWGVGLLGVLVTLRFLLKKGVFAKSKKFDVRKIFFGYSIPMYLLTIPMFLSGAVIPTLSLFFPQKLIGYYGFAMMFFSATALVYGSLSQVLFPKISELDMMRKYEEARSKLRRTSALYTLILIFLAAITFFFSEFFIRLVAAEYLPSLPLFKILVYLGLSFGYIEIYRAYLSAKARFKEIALLLLLRNVLLFVISFMLLKIYF